jgi:hypothetical protein
LKQSKEQAYDSNDDDLVRRTRIAFFISSALVILFAVSYGYLEYYYINDPVQGKTANLTVGGGTHRVATPILGGLYSYHIFPMIVIFILVGFGPFFDSVSFNILERHERRKAASLGVASVISAILVEDFAWFIFRWWLPLDNDPKRGLLMQPSDWTAHNIGGLIISKSSSFGGLVIPYWYLIACIVAGFFFYYAFKKPKKTKHDF